MKMFRMWEAQNKQTPAEQFLARVRAMGSPNPLLRGFIVIGDVDIKFSIDDDNTVSLDSVKNHGSPFALVALARSVLRIADELGVRIVGDIVPFGKNRLNKRRLSQFYRRFGAEKRGPLFVREPEQT